MIKRIVVVFLLVSLIPAWGGERCQNMFPNLISDICWKCMFPLRIGGKIVLRAGGVPDNVDTGNPDDFNPSEYTCSCTFDGKTYFGIWVSFWEPARVIEVNLKPGCFNFLFGTDLKDSLNLYGAYGSRGGGSPVPGDKAFYNIHVYSFPLLTVMDLIKDMDFCNDWMNDIDLMYFTEVDPLWNDEELLLWIHPEAGVFANPLAEAICASDCLAASADYPINSLFWCAGCWGGVYPFCGSTGAVGSPPRVTSLLAARMIAKLARTPVPPAMELDTSGPGAKCGKIEHMIRPLWKKSQYRFQMLKPVPETGTCHTLGSSTFLWGEWRNVFGPNETYIYLIWRKRNCCLRFL